MNIATIAPTMTSLELVEFTPEEADRIRRLVPQIVIDATKRMYSEAGTDADALIYTGSIVTSMIGTANGVVSLGLVTGDVSRDAYETLSKAATDCRGLAAMPLSRASRKPSLKPGTGCRYDHL